MRSWFVFPSLSRMTGGLAVIARLAGLLRKAGFDAVLVAEDCPERVEQAAPGVPVLPAAGLCPEPDDLWIVPEGRPTALMQGLRAGARCVVYVQNWAYLLSNLPEIWKTLPVQYVAVSNPVAWFIAHGTGRKAALLRPGIDTDLFRPLSQRLANPEAPTPERLRVAWMPRKNKAQARQIRDLLTARGENLQWVEIHGCSPAEVAELLRTSHVFLATGFPEGCPLPPLEALASGCLVAGWGGLGGWDYMRQAGDFPGAYRPWWPLEDLPWGGNGFYVADADVPAAAFAVQKACALLRSGGSELALVRAQAAATVQRYTLKAQAEAAVTLWRDLLRF